jgi:hypothetical protein
MSLRESSRTVSPSQSLSVLYSSLTNAASTLQHLHLPLGLGRDVSWLSLRHEIQALGQLHQLRSLFIAIPEGPVSLGDAGALLQLPKDYLPDLECLGVHLSLSPLAVGKLLECFATATYVISPLSPSLCSNRRMMIDYRRCKGLTCKARSTSRASTRSSRCMARSSL